MIHRTTTQLATGGANRAQAAGFTLIEVLVALVVLSIGLLGLAALQTAGLKYDHSAYQYSQATQLAYDILDRMRANRTAANSTSAYVTNYSDTSPAMTVDCGQVSNACTASDMAAYDIYQWKNQLEQTLPNATAQVSYSNATGSRIYTISIRWDNLGWDATKKALSRSNNLSFQLRSQV